MKIQTGFALRILIFFSVFWMHSVDAQTSLRDQVMASERAFAKTMADRDLVQFAQYISEEAVFFGATTSRGKKNIVAGWSGFFKETAAPFSWEPDQVEVLDSGMLALSTGPVRDASGKIIARFNSVWRLEAPNTWRVVFDKGSPPSPQRD